MDYNFREIEVKWQKYWRDNQTFIASNNSEKPKYYVLDMFPYPSGSGLHVGHPLGYIASDIYARYKRHQGYNVLHPQGYDSFGLPAEQYAIQTGQHPAVTTEINIANYRRQLDQIGFSFDWSREIRTSNPEYYKWTQWIFIQLFHSWYNKVTDKAEDIKTLIAIFETEGNQTVNATTEENITSFSSEEWKNFNSRKQQEILMQYRLTYLAESEVNWCAALGTVLANDEIINGVSERGGYTVVRKKMMQWNMRISAYAERLLKDLETLDWPQPLKDIQINWIGRSQGVMIRFAIEKHQDTIEVFTTRPDTIFGVSFMTLAPEHILVSKITTPEQQDAVSKYIEVTTKKSERDRMATVNIISGVFTGAYARHPFTGEKIPIWIGDYVLANYGTGAVMAVPCGDQRDYDFAKYFSIPIPNIFENASVSEKAFTDKGETVLANSDFLNGLSFKKATEIVISKIEQSGFGYKKINYKLRDAVFSRQRYWGEPFPVYYKDGMPHIISEEHLPIRLPQVAQYLPTRTGEPPLGNAEVWAWDTHNNTVVDSKKIDHCTVYPLELNTMPGWAGSSWYFNRYMDADNKESFASKEALDYWKEVDLYIGGSEHATGHLLYARFWQKFLFDRGMVPVKEFARKLINQGMITGNSAFVYKIEGEHKLVSKGLKDSYKTSPIHVDISLVNTLDELDIVAFKKWRPEYKNATFILEKNKYVVGREVEKMSKSKYNVVNPDHICKEYGADSLRLYEMFLGPIEHSKPWNTAGITGVHNFLKKFWKLYVSGGKTKFDETAPSKDNLKTLHKTIKKVTQHIESFSFNTSVSTLMIAVNELTAQRCTSKFVLEKLVILLSPYAPHIAEELWHLLGNSASIATAHFPKFESQYVTEDKKEYPISFNGKTRFTIELPLNMSKEEIEKSVLAHQKTQKQLQGSIPKKIIIVPSKIVNIVQ